VDGTSDIETNCAGRMVKLVVPVTEPDVALIVTLPTAKVVANPSESIETSVVFDELHVTDARSTELPSLNSPVATKDWETPIAIDAWSGERTIEVSVGALTVTVVEPAIDPRVAVTVTLPAATAVATPVLSTAATDKSDDDQVTCAVTSCELPSLQVPVALNCCVSLATSEVFDGVTAIEVNMGVTVRLLKPLREPIVAVIFVVPAASPVAIPEPLILAILVAVEDQVACVVTFLLLPSL
jgi:hypothetical protein